MARIETLVDDYDGTVATDDVEVETRRFSIGRTAYTIDLTAENYEKFLSTMQEWVEKATKEEAPNRAVRSSAPRKSSAGASGEDKPYNASDVREWAAGEGIEVSARGRIHKDIIEKFEYAKGFDKK